MVVEEAEMMKTLTVIQTVEEKKANWEDQKRTDLEVSQALAVGGDVEADLEAVRTRKVAKGDLRPTQYRKRNVG